MLVLVQLGLVLADRCERPGCAARTVELDGRLDGVEGLSKEGSVLVASEVPAVSVVDRRCHGET